MKPTFLAILLAIIMCFQCTISYAENKDEMIRAPHFFALGKVGSNDVLKMECEGQKPLYSNINCVFTHVIISKKTEIELAKERNRRQAELSKMTSKDVEQMKNILKQQKITKERLDLLNALTPEKKKYSDKVLAMTQDSAKSKNKTEAFNIINDFEEFDNQCCSIRVTTWKEEFQRVSQLKWISNPGPQGLCNVVRIKTLETDNDHYLLWKFTEITVSADYDKTRNDMFDKICADIKINQPTIYSWDVPTDMIMNCQCIKYSH